MRRAEEWRRLRALVGNRDGPERWAPAPGTSARRLGLCHEEGEDRALAVLADREATGVGMSAGGLITWPPSSPTFVAVTSQSATPK
jgi:hypothetical protein